MRYQNDDNNKTLVLKNANNSMARNKDRHGLNALGNLIKHLPTGTIFVFKFISPVLSNNGHCNRENKYLIAVLLALCGLNCILTTFIDSHKDEEGSTRYGVATVKGMWRPRSKKYGDGVYVDLSEYRVRPIDFVHAMIGVLVFGVVGVVDSKIVNCFVLRWEGYMQGVVVVLPLVVVVVCCVIFVVFPSKRNGIGYPFLVKNYER